MSWNLAQSFPSFPGTHFFPLRIPQGIYLYLHRSMLQLYFLRPPGGPTFHRGGQQPTIDLSARALAKSPSSIWHNPYISIKMEWPNTHTLACTCTNMRAHSSHPTWYGSCRDNDELVAADFWWGNGETGRIPDSAPEGWKEQEKEEEEEKKHEGVGGGGGRGGSVSAALQGKPCSGQYHQCSMQSNTACRPICLLVPCAKSIHQFEEHKKGGKKAIGCSQQNVDIDIDIVRTD